MIVEAGQPLLAIREAAPGAHERSERLRAIAERYRSAMPVRITRAADALSTDAPVRTLLPNGEEKIATGDRVVRLHNGGEVERTHAPFFESALRRLTLAWRRLRIRGYGNGSAALAQHLECSDEAPRRTRA